ncbi:hypothetical protein OE88DRAFT_1661907 [Heliocybe sulcata]|uniref:Heterokaryon incompatibility domain-containing protein n=1 Tax=Heliocybe sulcata TaxID=5364 RepID=A0A5C3MYY3_9AGAM|nr:hypothetical protein OE88DRAFT_1661907 [Heliocybe sulcata]
MGQGGKPHPVTLDQSILMMIVTAASKSIPGPLAHTRTRVPLQEPPWHGWPPHIISAADASLRLKDLGVDGVLHRLNRALGRRREIRMSDPGVKKLLTSFVESPENYDFGYFYGRVRHLWLGIDQPWRFSTGGSHAGRSRSFYSSAGRTLFKKNEFMDDVSARYTRLVDAGYAISRARDASISNDSIRKARSIQEPVVRDLIDRHSWTRRLWDLRAHRVVPYHFSLHWKNSAASRCPSSGFVAARPYAVSHSWTAAMTEGSSIDTAVNGHGWPVPLPAGVTLEAVRNELLHLGAEYAWLDVVCLRQLGGPAAGEALRAKEWAVDIPTIGAIYQGAKRIVRYYNGLGLAFDRGGWRGERHWLRRVWTIQEVRKGSIPAGLHTGIQFREDLLEQRSEEDGQPLRHYLQPVRDLERRLDIFTRLDEVHDLLRLIKELRDRFSTKPLDKVAAFGALLPISSIPLYEEGVDLERAWDRLLRRMPGKIAGQFLWHFRTPGTGEYKWRPSWKQLMSDDIDIVAHLWFPGHPQVLANNYARQSRCRLFLGDAQLTWGCFSSAEHAREGKVKRAKTEQLYSSGTASMAWSSTMSWCAGRFRFPQRRLDMRRSPSSMLTVLTVRYCEPSGTEETYSSCNQ